MAKSPEYPYMFPLLTDQDVTLVETTISTNPILDSHK